MALINGQFWYRWTNDCLLLTIISWGLLFHVDAWTYHYGANSDLTWEDARTFCQTWYTDLVAIQNKEEIAYLNEVLPKHSKYYWIGIRKINNTWTWVGTRKALTKEAENWAYREPNNKRSNQDCVEIYIKRDYEVGKWNDEPCGKKKRALCYKASCQPSSCNERSECVETIGNYTCQCYPGFYGPLCENVVQCNKFGPLHQALLLNCTHPLEQFSYRSHCSFRCDKGFTITGPVNLQCLSSGQWTAEEPQCAAVQCQPLNIPVNGNFSCSHIHGEFHYQSSCNFKCKEGFLINGAETTMCEASGAWSASEPTCRVKQCQPIQPPARGMIDCVNPIGNNSYNSTCSFACEVGFELSDSQPLLCNASGQWTSPKPTCQAVQCQPLEAPAHGNTTCVHLHGEFQYQSNCTFLCTKGFRLFGREVTECTASGKWTTPAPVCQAVECQPLNIPVNGNFSCNHIHGEFHYQSSCNFKCKEGFLINGAETTMCEASGAWSASEPTCRAVQCQPLNIPVNGNFSCNHIHGEFHYQSSCNFKCKEGFLINGAETTMCEASGAWSASEPTCRAVQCQPLNIPENGNFSCNHIHGEFHYQSNCNFKCKEGFLINRAETIMCEASGAWSASEPTCRAVQCQPLNIPENGNFSCNHIHGEFHYQSNCNFKCKEGFLINGAETIMCKASGAWSASEPTCRAVECQPLNIPVNGNFSCNHIHGEFHYQSSCNFKCKEGFLINGAETIMCEASGAWSASEPTCRVMQCHHLQNPKNGEMACSHPFAEFAYQSTCQFACEPGFLLNGTNTTTCLATKHWSSPLPACHVIECPNLDTPQNGELKCSHPHGSFAYNSSCAFSCDVGFVRIGTSQLQCTHLGKWSAATPSCEAAKCPFLQRPANGHLKCLHPHSHFAYGSSCNFSCNAGFQLVGQATLDCTALGNWTQEMPFCKAVQCPPLKNPENGKENCSNPYGHFAYYSSCTFSCDSGFELAGSEKLNCTNQGNWTGETPICEAIKCPPLKETENMKKNCSHPWGLFSYRSACRFYCTEGSTLNGTSRMHCQPDGRWSAEMPVCQENAANYLKQVLLYAAGVTASLVVLMISGGLIALAIKRLGKREEKKKLLSHSSELGVPGTYSNSGFDSIS